MARVLSIGEVLWDIIRGAEHIGGAPFNVAAHLARLGCDARILTRVGDDRRGRAALGEMERLGVATGLVQIDPGHPTGWAKVELTADGVATYRFADDPAYEFIEADDAVLSAIAETRFDAVCFGTLQQKGEATRRALTRVLGQVSARCVFYDVNVRQDFCPADVLRESLARSTVVKLNADETELVARRLYGGGLAEAELARRLGEDFPVRVVCVTKGGDGCTVHGDGAAHHCAGRPVDVADTVGSGDAFSAAFLEHYCRTGDYVAAAERGNRLGAYVASQPGAVPEYDESIRRGLGMA